MLGRTRVLVVGLGAVALTATAALIPAQSPADKKVDDSGRKSVVSATVQDVLIQPFDFSFGKPTKLEDVAAELGKAIKIQVVLDRAAMNRLDVRPDDTVQLELHGVRFKTGLRLLLDQLDMTYRVEPDDNLLVLTDSTGAADPLNRVLSEIETLHHDLHALQDSVDEVRAAMGLNGNEGEKLRKPTIIEPLPPGGESKPKSKPPLDPLSPRSRSGA